MVWAALMLALGGNSALAQSKYDPGASDSEIKIGQTTAYSGPFSSWSVVAKVQSAYFRMVNDKGGLKGRKLNLLSVDDAYSPPKTVEQTRKLIESEEVLLMFAPLGAASNTAIQKYLNAKKVPQLFVVSGASKWADPSNFPWTMGWMPSFANEGAAYANYLLAKKPDAKVAVFFQNDDFGKDFLRGFEEALGAKHAGMIVARANYLPTDPTVDSQIVTLKASGADVLFNASSPKFAAQAISKLHDIGWTPMHFLASPSANINAVFKVAGLERTAGIISAAFMKDPGDAALKDDKGVKAYLAFMAQYAPGTEVQDQNAVWGYSSAQTMARVLEQCGDDLTRENVMRQAANLKDVELGMLANGIMVNTSPTDFKPIEDERLVRFDGSKWDPLGD
jgi:branched-chain amino acid transport system substrate-binding protein